MVLVVLVSSAIAMAPCSATAAPTDNDTTVSSGGLIDGLQRPLPTTRLGLCPGCPCTLAITIPSAAVAWPPLNSHVSWTRPPEDCLHPRQPSVAFRPPRTGTPPASLTSQ